MPDGVFLDMRPGPADSAVLAGGELVGYLDESEFKRETLATGASLLATVGAGLFAFEGEV